MPKKVERTTMGERRKMFEELIFGEHAHIEEDTRIKRINVMTRIREDVVEVIDALLELGAFNSRSDAVSAYTERAILSRKTLYGELKERAKEVGRMRKSAIDLTLDELKDEDS